MQDLLVKSRQAITETWQQRPSACWNDPQHHYLTLIWHTQGHRATNARALNYTESGLKPCTDGRWNMLLTFAVIFFSVEMHGSSYRALTWAVFVLEAKLCSFPKSSQDKLLFQCWIRGLCMRVCCLVLLARTDALTLVRPPPPCCAGWSR